MPSYPNNFRSSQTLSNFLCIIPSTPFSNTYTAFFIMNGCRNASLGVHLFSGLRARHLSRRSANRFSSFISEALRPLDEVERRVFRSRVGLDRGRIRMVVWRERVSIEVRTKRRRCKCTYDGRWRERKSEVQEA